MRKITQLLIVSFALALSAVAQSAPIEALEAATHEALSSHDASTNQLTWAIRVAVAAAIATLVYLTLTSCWRIFVHRFHSMGLQPGSRWISSDGSVELRVDGQKSRSAMIVRRTLGRQDDWHIRRLRSESWSGSALHGPVVCPDHRGRVGWAVIHREPMNTLSVIVKDPRQDLLLNDRFTLVHDSS